MAKKKNRKKALKLQMKRQGLLSKAKQAVASVAETAKTVTQDVKDSFKKPSLEEFSALPELADIRSNLAETLYNEGIVSVQDFADWTEKDLLGLKGIGPATVKKLQENGVSLKA
ncbi:helix-hairpin-helix domain-containing protein [Streptococcus devriesei]|uniref:helix-hairpin-helix domain-containing protein n=1 Tax=Streptococcus devriesei TaxID=231233 RepID=UPI000410C72B|nr:helix-hairpin-helix domain-containing protein [Streptococcus devriesei]